MRLQGRNTHTAHRPTTDHNSADPFSRGARLSSPVNGTQLTEAAVILKATNAETTGSVRRQIQFEWSEVDSFPGGSRTGFKEDVEQGGDTTSFKSATR